MENNITTFDRDDLYEEVWRDPITKLAYKYGLSDVGLKKICKTLNVPTPPRGYWAKIQGNIKVKRTPLPQLKEGQRTTYTLQKGSNPINPAIDNQLRFSEEATELIEKFKLKTKKIEIPKRLVSPHPVVSQTLDVLLKKTPDEYGRVTARWEKASLDVSVSPQNIKRALRIIDTILKFFEKENIPCSTDSDDKNTQVRLFGQKIGFSMREPSVQTKHELTKKEKDDLKRWGRLHYSRPFDYSPSGKLCLEIDQWSADGLRKKWSDGKRPLEEFVGDFIITVVKTADIFRSNQIKREEERKREEDKYQNLVELKRLHEIEEERLQELENQSVMWAKSVRLRDFIQAVEDKAATRQRSEESNVKLQQWLTWAKAHAIQLDPLSKGLPFDFD